MADSHFSRLAFVEEWGSLYVCRHGIIHFRWKNATIRLTIDAFQRLVTLLGQGSSLSGPIPLCDGELCLAIEEAGYRLSIGSLDLLLTADAFLALLMLVKEASSRLEALFASDEWHQPPSAPRLDFDAHEVLRPHRFSLN